MHVSSGWPFADTLSRDEVENGRPNLPLSVRPVLVVEDHADTRHMVEEYLRFHGIPAVSARNGAEGLTALRETRPFLILLDLSMPVMDGWRFRAEQQRLSDGELAGVPVVVLSALSDCESQGAVLGAVDVIPKPIDFDRMIAVIKRFESCQGDVVTTA